MSTNPTGSSSSAAASGSSSGSTGGGGGGGSGPCGACKFLRRKCVAGCIFAPYFDSEQGAAHFAAVHKVFGASNVSKMLLHIPVHKRLDAVVTICYEAQARLRDPVYGCVSHIFALQQQVVNLQAELSYLQAHLATLELTSPTATSPAGQPHHHPIIIPPPAAALSIADLPTAVAGGGSSTSSSTSSSVVPATYDLSTLFDPMVHPSSSWNNNNTMQMMMQQRPSTAAVDLRQHQFGGIRNSGGETSSTSGGDLQELARELLHRHGLTSSTVVLPCNTEPSSLPPHSK